QPLCFAGREIGHGNARGRKRVEPCNAARRSVDGNETVRHVAADILCNLSAEIRVECLLAAMEGRAIVFGAERLDTKRQARPLPAEEVAVTAKGFFKRRSWRRGIEDGAGDLSLVLKRKLDDFRFLNSPAGGFVGGGNNEVRQGAALDLRGSLEATMYGPR